MLDEKMLAQSIENMKLCDASKMMQQIEELLKCKCKVTINMTMLNKGIDQFYTKKMKNETLSEVDIEILKKNFDELKDIFETIISL